MLEGSLRDSLVNSSPTLWSLSEFFSYSKFKLPPDWHGVHDVADDGVVQVGVDQRPVLALHRHRGGVQVGGLQR